MQAKLAPISAATLAVVLTVTMTACGASAAEQANADAQLCRELSNAGKPFFQDVWSRLFVAGNTPHVTENIPADTMLGELDQLKTLGSGGDLEQASPPFSQTFTTLTTEAQHLQDAAHATAPGGGREISA
jgi:hypothetical protein